MIVWAAAVLCGSELCLSVFPLRKLLGWSDGIHCRCRFLSQGLPARLAQAVSLALPRADERLRLLKPSCLRRALAARALLGPATRLCIGVKRVNGGALQAHAWIGSDPADAEDFVELAAL